MRIFLAGATGAIGQSLTPALLAAGHAVHGTTRSAVHARALEATGATPVLLDALDRDAVLRAVEQAKPDVIVHQLTSITRMNPKTFDADFALTNRLRTEGVDHLLEAARVSGVGRVIAQSYAGWPNPRIGPNGTTGPADETEPLDPHPGKEARQSLAAIRHVEESVAGATDLEGLVLRYGGLYGPGTGIAKGERGDMLAMVLTRKFPLVGTGAGVWSFVHVADAADATVAAIERGEPGLYNIVDDDPAPVSEWLPALAAALGAKPPRHVPAWLAKPLLGEHGLTMMTAARGSSNAKAKRVLGWTPKHPTWRTTFAEGL